MANNAKKRLGAEGEAAVAQYLLQNNCTILQKNYSVRAGEVDIIFKEHDTIVFAEVKTRSSTRFGTPAEAVTKTKQQRMAQVALHYMAQNGTELPLRFDVMEVFAANGGFTITHIKNAFYVES